MISILLKNTPEEAGNKISLQYCRLFLVLTDAKCPWGWGVGGGGGGGGGGNETFRVILTS